VAVLTPHLLGRGELGRHRRHLGLGPLRAQAAGEQLGDAEIEQLGPAVGGHQDVRRLEIPVNDQVLVGVAHRLADLHHQLEPPLDGELVLVAVADQRLALDQLHGEVRQPVGGHAALEQSRDARMLEQRQDPALLEEAAEHSRRGPLDQLDRGPLLELPVGPLAEIHGAHAAPAEQPDDPPGADALGLAELGHLGGLEQGLRPRHRRRRLEEALAPVRVQQAQHLGVDLGLVAGGALGERHLLVGGDVEQGVEDGVDPAVAVGRRG
jgi:hypothetical protein